MDKRFEKSTFRQRGFHCDFCKLQTIQYGNEPDLTICPNCGPTPFGGVEHPVTKVFDQKVTVSKQIEPWA